MPKLIQAIWAAFARWQRRIVQYITGQLGKIWRRLPTSLRQILTHSGRALFNFREYGARQAAAITYYALFATFPLILLLAIGAGRILGPAVAQKQIADALSLVLPAQALSEIQRSLEQAILQGAPFVVVALLGLLWSSLGLFANLTAALDFIFRASSERGVWQQQLTAFAMSVVFIFLMGVSFLTSAALQLVSVFLLNTTSTWLTIGITFLPAGLNMVIFVLLFRFIPRQTVYWDAIWPAALLGATGWELTKWVFRWYLSTVANYQFVYGVFFTAIVLFLGAYVVMAITLFSAEICAQMNEWITGQRQQPLAQPQRLLPEGGE